MLLAPFSYARWYASEKSCALACEVVGSVLSEPGAGKTLRAAYPPVAVLAPIPNEHVRLDIDGIFF